MKKKLLLLLTTLSLIAGLSVLGAPSALAGDVNCTGYSTLASVSDNTGTHRLYTQANICINDTGSSPNQQWGYGSVVHFKCYRDGVLFGDGTGGCRWAGHQVVYNTSFSPDLVLLDNGFAIPGGASSAYWSDSGRINSRTTTTNQSASVRVCLRQGLIHFMGATGIDYGLFNMADKCTLTTHH